MTDPVKVFGTYLDANNRPMTGSVTFVPDVHAPDDTPGTVLKTQQPVVARLDQDGYFEVMLTASDDDGWRTTDSIPYRVDERIPGLERQRLVFVLAPGPVDLNTQPDVPLDYTGPVEVPVPGVPGPAGPANSLAIGTVTTGAPGSAASASITGTPPAQTLNLGIPAGNTGAAGPAGSSGAAGTPGAPGAPGGTGPAGAAATVTAGTTVTTAPGTNAAVTNSGTSSAAKFDFQIPRGAVGATGATGGAGSQGPAGIQGPQGTPATVTAGTTQTSAPGSMAAVTNGGSTSNAVFNFQIPRGDVGPTGPASTVPGPVGPTGPTGAQGIPGDLSQAKADTLYEPKSDLLREAAWYVDAGVIGTGNDRLLDITGRGRDAVFGAGAASPVILPWSGEDYIDIRGTGNAVYIITAIPLTETITARVRSSVDVYLLQQTQTIGSLSVVVDALGAVVCAVWDGAASRSVTFPSGSVPVGAVWHDLIIGVTATGFTLTVDGVSKGTLATGYTRSAAPSLVTQLGPGWAGASAQVSRITIGTTHILDPRNVSADYTTIANTGSAGGNWTITRAATGYKTAVVDRPLLLFGGSQTVEAQGTGSAPTAKGCTLVAAIRRFGNGTYNAIYLATGDVLAPTFGAFMQQSSGNTITFAVASGSGYDILSPAQVDGAVVLGMVGEPTKMTAYPSGQVDATVARVGNDPIWKATDGIYMGKIKGMASSGAWEFSAAAIFDRALTPAEIAQVSQELAGTSHAKQPDPHPQYALEAGIGNLLTDNQASGTDTLATTAGFLVFNVTVASDTNQAAQGTRSLLATATATAGASIYTPTGVAAIPVSPGAAYTATVSARLGVGVRTCKLQITFWTAAGANLGPVYAPATAVTGSAFTPLSVTAIVPATAAFASIAVELNAGAIGDSVYLDMWGFWKGASGAWAMPGTPITGLQSSMEQVTLWADLPASGNWLGRRIQVTSGLGFLVALWNGTAWVVSAESDTGLRTVSSWDAAGVVTGRAIGSTWEPYPTIAGSITVQRKGDAMTISFATGILRAKQDSPSVIYSGLPAGWRPIISDSRIYPTNGFPWALTLASDGNFIRSGNANIANQSISADRSSATHTLAGAPWPVVAP